MRKLVDRKREGEGGMREREIKRERAGGRGPREREGGREGVDYATHTTHRHNTDARLKTMIRLIP